MNSGAFENIAHKDENGKPRRACGKTAAARLGDVATYINGYAFKPEDWSQTGLPIIRIQDLTGNSYQANRYNGEYEQKYEVNKGDVLISWSASLGVYVWRGEKAVLNQHIFKVVFDKAEISKSFFVHQVEYILKRAASSAHGATMKHLTKPVFDALPFILPPLDEQRRIASLLDKISELAAKRRRQLDKLDELVKSRFVEMFVDFMDNHDDKMTLADVCKIITDGTHQSPKFVSSGIPFLFVSNIVTNEITYEAEKFISEDTYQELIKRTPVEPGDILLSTVGSYGHPAIVKSDKPFCFQRHIAYLKPKSDLVDSVYLHSAILSDDVQRQIEKSVKGIAQKTLNLSEIRKIKVPLPSLDLQRRFSETVGHIDKIKLKVHASLEKLETLKKSKMQEFFGNAG